MSNFDENKIRRAGDGKFANKDAQRESAGQIADIGLDGDESEFSPKRLSDLRPGDRFIAPADGHYKRDTELMVVSYDEDGVLTHDGDFHDGSKVALAAAANSVDHERIDARKYHDPNRYFNAVADMHDIDVRTTNTHTVMTRPDGATFVTDKMPAQVSGYLTMLHENVDHGSSKSDEHFVNYYASFGGDVSEAPNFREARQFEEFVGKAASYDFDMTPTRAGNFEGSKPSLPAGAEDADRISDIDYEFEVADDGGVTERWQWQSEGMMEWNDGGETPRQKDTTFDVSYTRETDADGVVWDEYQDSEESGIRNP